MKKFVAAHKALSITIAAVQVIGIVAAVVVPIALSRANAPATDKTENDKSESEPTLVKRCTLSPDTATLKVGETLTITAIVTPDNADNQNVTWNTSAIEIATIDTDTTLDSGYSESRSSYSSSVNSSFSETTDGVEYVPVETAGISYGKPLETADEAAESAGTSNGTPIDNKNEITITAVGPGKVTITATTEDGNFIGYTEITVTGQNGEAGEDKTISITDISQLNGTAAATQAEKENGKKAPSTKADG